MITDSLRKANGGGPEEVQDNHADRLENSSAQALRSSVLGPECSLRVLIIRFFDPKTADLTYLINLGNFVSKVLSIG